MTEITTVSQLRAFLDSQPDNAPILCQVVGAETGVWNMVLSGGYGADSHFLWSPQPVILQMRHPAVKHLATVEQVNEAGELKRKINAAMKTLAMENP
jgi:hypothetical protein